MPLRRRSPGIPTSSPDPAEGFEHLDPKWIAVLRWLAVNQIDYVLVGAVAHALRGATDATGAVVIVPAPYGRNYQRLCSALWTARARIRVDGSKPGDPESLPVKLSPEKLARDRWAFRCGIHEIDVDPSPAHESGQETEASRYQELLYEANRFELAAGVSVEVASPEDVEHYEHLRRTGLAPEIRISLQTRVENDAP